MSTATHTEYNKPSAGGSAPASTYTGPGLTPQHLSSDGVIRVLRDDGSLDPSTDPGLSADEVIALYKAMIRTRLLDDRLVTLQRQGRIGFHIGALGEEAAILGSTAGMRDKDWIFPCYREFAAMLWRGLPLQRYIDNMFGNANDPVRGRQMPDHYTYREGRFGSVSSPIGTQIVQATGFAWAAKMRKEELAVLVYFGDGATSSSDFHNGMNFAGVFKAPVVFLCRNNGWAISVPTERQTASATFAEKGVAYGIPGVRVDGNDLFAVVKATREATARAARGEGPTIIEALTYRMSGHSTSDDPKAYRPDNTLDAWKTLDPIQRMRRHLTREHGWTEAQDKQLETEFDAELRACVAVAEKTAAPPLESMFEDVFAELPWHLREQREELLKGPRAKGHGGGH
ncbi:thiamine pyrophosphate-dependent dehydrogenase E1 component subunit alpha [Chondromyces apiculatus]|uniref:2-oxoisovalerate dehydrogenase subunit alpha n=1 Tax=Chondromyces apiculatus DSM 436 TaxID=1192034 RepID=A0A017THK0_9BACT|nr:thiamine pyrophosphate-dependent enzyme [Chondromyces apiculatus]EYF08320.1 Branched-chain alpha-keto acid dehydrogenase, E1 component, alpha subunit [Chondromyces apiculatus DSM 436]